MIRWRSFRILSTLLLLWLTACQSSAPSATPNSRLDEIRAAGQLKIGTAITRPFEYRDTVTNTLIGFDVELMTEVFASEAIVLTWREMAFADLLPELQAGQVDVVIAAMYITPAREALIDFSQPYLATGLVLVVQTDNTNIQTVNDLDGKILGVKEGSTGARKAEELRDIDGLNFQIRRYTDTLDSLDDLDSRLLDAVLNDQLNTLEYIKIHPNIRIQGEVLEPAGLGIAVQTGDTELLDFINLQLTRLQNEQKIQQLFDRWINPEMIHAVP
jgi:ABC-type amino acid transport substrate-binding protein